MRARHPSPRAGASDGTASVAFVRRLLVLVSAVVLVDTMLYAALTPLLPELSRDLGLSKTGAGLLVASYAVGVLAGAFPAGLAAARLGAKRAALAGLVVVGAASVGFAFAGDPWTLGLARLAQGLGSALSWAGGLAWLVSATPRGRRGQVLGTALGAAVFGALLGPVLGGAAALFGMRPTFSAVAVVALVVALVGLREPGVAREKPSLASLARAFAEPRFLGGLWLMLLPALLFGVLTVLVPLELDRLGWAAVAIGGLFLASAAVEGVINPFVGRIADRRGALRPVRFALAAGVGVSLALAWADTPALVAAFVLAAAVAYGALFTPGLALVSRGADRAGLPQGLAFGITNAGWALGAAAGPSFGGALGDAVGDAAAYGVGAAACAVTLVAVTRLPFLGTRITRVPEGS
jgi:MFS family permease